MLTPVEEAATASLAPTGARVIRLHPEDDVVISLDQLVSGVFIASEKVTAQGVIPPGHNVASRAIEDGRAVWRYGQIVGVASQSIRAAPAVHCHNPAIKEF